MNVKIDTKQKFTVITPDEAAFAANMTDKLSDLLLTYLQKDIPHVVFNMELVTQIDDAACEFLVTHQQQFYENDCSFVICNLQKEVRQQLEQKELLDIMNITPTESEAWDIVQMEEIERELLNDN
jgi:anti-anti-sigma factor